MLERLEEEKGEIRRKNGRIVSSMNAQMNGRIR